MAILNKYKKKWKTSLLLRKDRYYDFVLSHDNTPSIPLNGNLTKRCLIGYIDTNNKDCIISNTSVLSDYNYNYTKSIVDGTTLKNIGFTGIDTSLVTFDKDTITIDEFTNLIQTTTLDISSGDTRLKLIPVSGNTKIYNSLSTSLDNHLLTIIESVSSVTLIWAIVFLFLVSVNSILKT